MDAPHIVGHVIFHGPLTQRLTIAIGLSDGLEAIAHFQVRETALEDLTALMQTFPLHVVSSALLGLLRQDSGFT